MDTIVAPNVSAASSTVALLSVNVGRPKVIGKYRGQPVTSGILKQPVTTESLALDWTNLAGDQQADLIFHGGREKAVFVYPSEHLAYWTEYLKRDTPFTPGSFGDNLTVAGWFEDGINIGDIWAWGDAQLQVVQPRIPCYKLGIAVGTQKIAKQFTAEGRTGWYMSVLQTGAVPVSGPITVVERHPAGVTVLDAHRALTATFDRAAIDRVLAVEPLSAAWREILERRLSSDGMSGDQAKDAFIAARLADSA